MTEVRMSGELDPKIRERLVFSAICRLPPTRGDKILCNRGVLKQAILRVVQEAYEIGRLAGEKERLGDVTRPGNSDRPALLDIRFDDPDTLANSKIRLKPVVLNTLLDTWI